MVSNRLFPLGWVSLLALVAGCLNNAGTDPPAQELNFPIALTMGTQGPEATHLFVLNSNFDLRYNAGSLMSIDLACLDERLAACTGEDCVLAMGEGSCPTVVSEVWVASHGAGLAISPAGDRLYAPMRSTNDLTFVDVDESGNLGCGATASPGACAESFTQLAVSDELTVPTDPVAISVGDLAAVEPGASGVFIVQAHRSGATSLAIERDGGAPTLVDVRPGSDGSVIGLTARPGSDEFWLARNRGAGIRRVELAWPDGTVEDANRPILFDRGAIQVSGVDFSSSALADIRALRFDPREGRSEVYALSRRPESVLIADSAGILGGELEVQRAIEVGVGPSRLALEEIEGRLYGFVSCFDSQDLYVLDLDRGLLMGVVRGLSGPFELQVDVARQRIYVADFRSSVIRVVDISALVACAASGSSSSGGCTPTLLATLGVPRPVMELQ